MIRPVCGSTSTWAISSKRYHSKANWPDRGLRVEHAENGLISAYSIQIIILTLRFHYR